MNLLTESQTNPGNFKKKQNWEKEHELDLVIDMKVIVDDILDNIFEQIEFNEDEKINEYVSFTIDNQKINAGVIIDTDKRFVTDFYRKIKTGFLVPITKNFFSQVRVHQQQIEEFDGYHMLYNTFQIIKFYRTGKSIYLRQLLSYSNGSNANFWEFKQKMSESLKRAVKVFNIPKSKYYTDDYCLNGELLKEHLVILLSQTNRIRNAFMTNGSMYTRILRIVKKEQHSNYMSIFYRLIGTPFNPRTALQHRLHDPAKNDGPSSAHLHPFKRFQRRQHEHLPA
jgi:hypothetical protein